MENRLPFISASDSFERSAFRKSPLDNHKRSQHEEIPDSAPVLMYTETEAQLGYSSTGYNNATISLNQVSCHSGARFIKYSVVDKQSFSMIN
jgi:hypothetical protein